MELTYQLRKEDLLVLTDELTRRSPTARRLVRRAMGITFLTSAFVCFCVWLLTGATEVALGTFAICMVFVVLVPLRIKRSQRRVTVSLYGEGKNRGLFLPTTLSVDRDSLFWSSESGSGHVKLEYIESVRHIDTHLLIYLTVRNAYVVPRDGVISGDFESFSWELERRWKSAMDRIAEPHEMHSL